MSLKRTSSAAGAPASAEGGSLSAEQIELLLTEFEGVAGQRDMLHAQYQGKAMPDDVYARFVRLRDERLPALKKKLRAALASKVQPKDMVLVPRQFVTRFYDLAHNYSQRAVAPDYYQGTERDAFESAYARCGSDLIDLRNLLTVQSPAVAHGWQPIEQAPKVGPLLLLFPPIGGWVAGAWRGSWSYVEECWVIQTPMQDATGRNVCLTLPEQPTAFMPLPEASQPPVQPMGGE